MKLRIYNKSGTVRVETEKKSYDFYEFQDGMHVIPPEGVYRDREGKRPAIVTFFDGLIAPLGSVQNMSLVDKTWLNMDMRKDSGAPPSVSKGWARSLAAFMDAATPYLPIVIIGLLLLYAIATTDGNLI
jgi:hypothetical protein